MPRHRTLVCDVALPCYVPGRCFSRGTRRSVSMFERPSTYSHRVHVFPRRGNERGKAPKRSPPSLAQLLRRHILLLVRFKPLPPSLPPSLPLSLSFLPSLLASHRGHVVFRSLLTSSATTTALASTSHGTRWNRAGSPRPAGTVSSSFGTKKMKSSGARTRVLYFGSQRNTGWRVGKGGAGNGRRV